MAKKIIKFIIKATDTAKELFLIYLGVIAIAAISYSLFEHKAIFDSIWWSIVTAMTVGYGDTYPVTIGGRVTAMILMHAVPLFVIPLITARLSSKLIVNSDTFTHSEQEKIKKGIEDIKKHLGI